MTLAARWAALGARLGARHWAPFGDLESRYGEPTRAYHTLAHIEECLRAYGASGMYDPWLELALWLHDVIYDPRAHDNEARSAELARRWILAADLGPQVAEAVAAAIRATEHRSAPADGREALIQDIDLAIFATSHARLFEYERQIRHEYAWVPADQYIAGRRTVLAGFLVRPQLYRTAMYRQGLEDIARSNLAELITALSAPPTSGHIGTLPVSPDVA
jgi:predicted metal-dependent HD superfamily phosphohydrolase